MVTLTSRNNPKVKQIRQLLGQRKERDSSGLFVVEGIRHVGEACAAHAGVEYLLYAPDLLNSEFARQLILDQERLGIPCIAVEKEIFAGLAGKENPQGIVAVVRQPHRALEDLQVDQFTWGAALVAPQDPGNIGSILRTIDAVGASGLLLLDDPGSQQFCADPYHPSAVRASMGAMFWHPLVHTTFSSFTRWAQACGCHVYGTSAHASRDYRSVEKYELPCVLLMGSEREGLTQAQAAACEVVLSMPMNGRVTSLNLSVAAGVLLYSMAGKLG